MHFQVRLTHMVLAEWLTLHTTVSLDWLLLFCSLVGSVWCFPHCALLGGCWGCTCASACHCWMGPSCFHTWMGWQHSQGKCASVALSGIMCYHCSWQLSAVTPQAALTWMPKISSLDILQGYLLIQTILVAEHNWNTDGPPCRGGEWGEVSQAVISHTFKWPSALLLGKQLILALVQDTCFICWWNALYHPGSGSGGVWLLPVCSMHSPLQEEHCSAAAAHCTSPLCFCWESVYNFPPLLPQRQEMSQCLCSVLILWTAFALLSLVRGRKTAFL